MEIENSEYNKIKIEVEDFVNQITNDESLKKILEKHYKGTQILFSPLYNKPNIMLIGINPGAGYNKNEDKNVKRFNPMKFMEYVGGGYMLARQTRKLFELSGLTISDLKNSVKTNCFFIATTNAKELDALLKNLEKYNIRTKSQKWINSLIEIVEPKLIICEGKKAFKELIKDENFQFTSKKGPYFTTLNSIPVIGYDRKFSVIKEKQQVAKLINEKLKEKELTTL